MTFTWTVQDGVLGWSQPIVRRGRLKFQRCTRPEIPTPICRTPSAATCQNTRWLHHSSTMLCWGVTPISLAMSSTPKLSSACSMVRQERPRGTQVIEKCDVRACSMEPRTQLRRTAQKRSKVVALSSSGLIRLELGRMAAEGSIHMVIRRIGGQSWRSRFPAVRHPAPPATATKANCVASRPLNPQQA